MKGIIFTEFLEMVEARFSPEVVDRIIEACELPSGGAYTAVGTYDHQEIVQLVMQLSTVTEIPVPDLLRAYGTHLFSRFIVAYPQFFAGVDTTFAFLQNIEKHIHTEVRKLYPDADLPSFTYETADPRYLTMIYQSTRPFAALAEGLIMGCIAHFGEQIEVHCEDLSDGQGTCMRFSLTKRG
jgi:hypothetical protein